MAKFLIEALTGPLKGKRIEVKDGLSFGREKGDIILKDSSVSEFHAEIQIYSSGTVMIVDQDSKNKIFINKKRVVKSVLESGNVFKIGQSEFIFKINYSPKEIWNTFIKKQMNKVEDTPMSLKVFVKPIKVNFLSGLQKNKNYKLYYGPRFFGRHSVDCPIFDSKAPKKAFVLIPQKKDILFKSFDTKSIQVNKKPLEQVSVKNGDKILVGDSLLEIQLGQMK
ncbi:MAG: FHA domain-containing protein [Bdellovibrionales bacterium]|nr:FHA domain-containing protein [Bdellovibrionales bacterium]